MTPTLAESNRTPPPCPDPIDEARWDALMRRDREADGTFVYAVRTTGVYCRPSCGSRRPRRANVRTFADGLEAERAGFRPCKRCRPSGLDASDRQARAVEIACRAIEAADSMPSLDALAEAAGLSRSHFHRAFRARTGLTPRAYADAHRTRRVAEVLDAGGSVTRAIVESGFSSSGRFYESAADRLGMTPTAYRSGGDGASIRFAVGDCWLGSALVAATDRGVCAILLGDDPEALIRDLEARFPKADLIGGDVEFERLVARVVALVEAPGLGIDLPLDIRGTAFQRRVWEALRAIPAGSTASYAEIAARIGLPKSVRAVAGACASNPIAVAIPCHRVVRTDGLLSGYRWGIERKRALLDREASS